MPWTPAFHHGYILQTGGDPANIFMANCTHFIKSFFEQAFDFCQLTQPMNRSLTGPISTAYYDDWYDISTGTSGFMAIRNRRLLADLGTCDPQFSVSTMLDVISASIRGAVNCLEQYFNNHDYVQCKPEKAMPFGEEAGIVFGTTGAVMVLCVCAIAAVIVLSLCSRLQRQQQRHSSSDSVETTPLSKSITNDVTYDAMAREDYSKALSAL